MNINVLGYGVMAQQIAALLVNLGHSVTIWNHKPIDLSKVNRQIKLQKRMLDFEDSVEGNLNVISKLSDLENFMTIESVSEDLVLKNKIYQELSQKLTMGYYTNSSSYSPSEIGDNVGGLHFFNPISKMKLIEYCPSTHNEKQLLSLFKQLESIDFSVAEVKNSRGYIANFIMFNDISNVFKLIELYNYEVGEVKKVYSTLYARNFFNTIDIIGTDVTYKIISNLKEKDPDIYLPKILKKAMEAKILGKKNKTSIEKFVLQYKKNN
jgi:3-hydroxybutyryl-CoA dehydrogenase